MGESAFMNELRAEGRVEGRVEGRTEGEREAQRKNLLRVLELRFPKKLPKDVVAAVKAESDTVKLEAWLDAAVTAATPDEFRIAMSR